MNRLNRAVVAIGVCGGLLVATPLFAQKPTTAQQKPPATTTPQKQPATTLGKFLRPVRGVAEVQHLPTKIQRTKTEIITTITIKNVSNAPIAGLKLDETWYDKQGGLVPGGDTQRLAKPLQPGEVATVVLKDPLEPRMYNQRLQFSHTYGTVKTTPVKKF